MKKLMFMSFLLFAIFFVSCDKNNNNTRFGNFLKTPSLSGASNINIVNFFEKFRFSDTLDTNKKPPTHTFVFETGTNHVSIEVSEYGAKHEFIAGKGAVIGYVAGNPIYVYVNTGKYVGIFIGEDNINPKSIECVIFESLNYFVNKSFAFQDVTKSSNGSKYYELVEVP